MRALLIILDGLADRKWPDLGGKTPLEAAKTPNMDRLAAAGATGLMHPLGRGVAPSSELSHFALFGYPLDLYPGRGVFEALGHGLALEEGDVAVHLLLSSVERTGDLLLVKERPSVAPDDVCKELLSAVPEMAIEGLDLKPCFTKSSQGILLIRGGASKNVTDSDPYYLEKPVSAVRPVEALSDLRAAEATARAISAFLISAHAAMDEHPINDLRRSRGDRPVNFALTKWAGKYAPVRSFEENGGFKAASVCSYPLYKGLARFLGMAVIDVAKSTDPGEDLLMRLKAAEKAFDEGYEFVHVHSKAPDDAGHEKKPLLKKSVLERLDAALEYIFDSSLIDDDNLIVLTGDHATPSGTQLLHSGDPVPLLAVGKNAWPDGVSSFGESACASGYLGQFKGSDLLPMILNFTDRIRYMGATLTPKPTLYEPKKLPPLKL